MKRVIISVNNDIETDQRIGRTAGSFMASGYDVCIVGRKLPGSSNYKPAAFRLRRFRILFSRGPLSYICFNIRLFFFLLVRKADILQSNDLDTLLPNYLAGRIKGISLLYDAHEYFTELPELVGRPFTKKIWKVVEGLLLPGIKYSYTVNQSIADLYKKEYSMGMAVIRNLPLLDNSDMNRKEDQHPGGKKIIIYQGVLNIGRRLDIMVEAMNYIEDALLIIAGDGPEISKLIDIIQANKLDDRVQLTGRLKPSDLRILTAQADLGLSIEENLGLNYYYALPNKLFDYIHALVPVLVSPFPEMKNLVENYNIGESMLSGEPARLGEQISRMLGDRSKVKEWKENLVLAREELCWQNEENKLIDIISKIESGEPMV